MTVATMERLVSMKNCLYPVGTRRELGQTFKRISKNIVADNHLFAGLEGIHIETEYLYRIHTRFNLEPGIDLSFVRDQKQDPAVDRVSAYRAVEGDGYFECMNGYPESLHQQERGKDWCPSERPPPLGSFPDLWIQVRGSLVTSEGFDRSLFIFEDVEHPGNLGYGKNVANIRWQL